MSTALHPIRRAVLNCGDDIWAFEYVPQITDEYRGYTDRFEPSELDGAWGALLSYDEYLRTPEWREYRDAIVRRQGGVCAMCPRPAQEVHHRTYKHIGWEADGDCVALCSRCHAAHHGKAARR